MYCLPFIYLIPLSNKLKLVLTLVNIARIVLFQLMSKLQRKICRLLLFIFFRGILFACLMFSLQQGCIFTRKVDWYLLQIKGFFCVQITVPRVSLCPFQCICVAAGLRPSKPQVFHKAVSLFVAQTLPGLTRAASTWLSAL